MRQPNAALDLTHRPPVVPPRFRLVAGPGEPHLHCPRCEAPTLVEIVRSGVPIDRCRLCGGVWLDPGELEWFAER